MKKVLSLFLLLVILVGCNSIPESSSVNIPSSSVSVEEKGVNGMTETEIKEIAKNLIEGGNDLYQWLRYYCHQDLDESLEKIYDLDEHSPEGFYWEPVSRFKTRDALYEHTMKIYTLKQTKAVLDWLLGDDIAGFSEGADSVQFIYIDFFKEIDGRLYVRSDYGNEKYEDHKYYDLDLSTTILVDERENEILVASNYTGYTAKTYHTLVLENSNWVLTDDGGGTMPEDWE